MQLNKMVATAILMVSALLAGCQTTNPYTGEQQTNKSTKYGLGGVLAGAALGALADGKDGALKGAVLGGAAGAGYGYYLDKQEAVLRSELQGTGVQVYRQGDQLSLIMPSNITFDSSRSAIKSAFYPVLGSVAKVFKEYDRNLIEIVGYTDSTGGDKINLPLSQQRAESVADYLVFQGVPATRISAFGQGSADPIASNSTSAGRAQNRRVEINLLPAPQR
ncbi:OmpA family protein [uncultured Endozoicomonas sp.]|uniref:OmpA family protein n=1 Tax=uncultured Endozoicomonas sp. TaxID=432652 RepID=UPI00262CA8B3|nr:OmpA family protein [uncultured Endozoicomonas sp.]